MTLTRWSQICILNDNYFDTLGWNSFWRNVFPFLNKCEDWVLKKCFVKVTKFAESIYEWSSRYNFTWMCKRLLLLYVWLSRIYSTSWFSLDYYNFRKVSSNFFWCTYSCGQHQTHLKKVYTKFWPSLHKLQSFQKVLKSFLKNCK